MRKLTVLILSFALWTPLTADVIEVPFIFTACTDYEVGKLSWFDPLTPGDVHTDIADIHSDAVLRWHDDLLYVVNRYGADNVQVIDPASGCATILQFSTGTATNPQDIAFAAGKAYVSRNDHNEILVVDPATGNQLGVVDLSAWADGDGYAEPAGMAACGDLVFVAIQRLDRSFWWLPVGDSYLAVIDATTDQLVDVNPDQGGVQAIALTATNPTWEIEQGGDLLYLSCTGAFGVNDGGLELVDPVGLTSLGLAITESELGGDLGDVTVVDESLAWAIVGDASFNTHLMRIDLLAGAATLHEAGAGYVFTDLEYSPLGDLYVTDRAWGAEGLRIYDAVSGDLIEDTFSMGLPPFDILVAVNENTAADNLPPLPDRQLLAWPNPFNPMTTISWQGFSAGAGRLSIFDARGRLVHSRRVDLNDGAITWKADGLSSGVYLARVSGERQTAVCRLVLLR